MAYLLYSLATDTLLLRLHLCVMCHNSRCHSRTFPYRVECKQPLLYGWGTLAWNWVEFWQLSPPRPIGAGHEEQHSGSEPPRPCGWGLRSRLSSILSSMWGLSEKFAGVLTGHAPQASGFSHGEDVSGWDVDHTGAVAVSCCIWWLPGWYSQVQ